MATAKKKKYTKIGRNGEMIDVEHDEIQKKKSSSWNIPPEYMNLGLYLALPLLIGGFLGQFLDRKFGTKAIFTISFIIFGTISVFYNLFKLYSKDGNKRNSS